MDGAGKREGVRLSDGANGQSNAPERDSIMTPAKMRQFPGTGELLRMSTAALTVILTALSVAIPFFILAGYLMNQGGLSE